MLFKAPLTLFTSKDKKKRFLKKCLHRERAAVDISFLLATLNSRRWVVLPHVTEISGTLFAFVDQKLIEISPVSIEI